MSFTRKLAYGISLDVAFLLLFIVLVVVLVSLFLLLVVFCSDLDLFWLDRMGLDCEFRIR